MERGGRIGAENMICCIDVHRTILFFICLEVVYCASLHSIHVCTCKIEEISCVVPMGGWEFSYCSVIMRGKTDGR